MAEEDFKQYHVVGQLEARPYVPGEDMTDIRVGGMVPKEGDMIARDPANRDYLFLINQENFGAYVETGSRAASPQAKQQRPKRAEF